MRYKPKVGDIFYAVNENSGFRFFEITDISDDGISMKEISSEIRPSDDKKHPDSTFFSVPLRGNFKGKTLGEQNVAGTKHPAIMVSGRFRSTLWDGEPLFFRSPGTAIVNVDERGDFGYKSESSRTMVIAFSVIPHHKDFHTIARRHPANTRGSKTDGILKFHSSSDEVRKAVIDDIAKTDADIYAATYRKDMKKGPDDTLSGSQIYERLFEDMVDTVMSGVHSESILFIIDDSTYITRDVAYGIVRKYASGYDKKILDCVLANVKAELLLQTHDFIVGGLGVREEENDHTYVKKLGPRIKIWKRRKQ